MNAVLAGVLVYVVLQLLVVVYVARRNKNEDDYLLAGRRLGFFIATMTIFATWFGAETCIGAAGWIYEEGLSGGRADPFGYALCIVVMGLFFAVFFWKLQLTTLGDYFRIRYGVAVEKCAILLMIPTSLLWAAAQIRAFGQVLSASSELNVTFAITIAAGVVIVYTAMGGLLADAITDLFQGLVLVFGLIVLAVAIAFSSDGIDFSAALSPERMSLKLPEDSWLLQLESWSVPILGSLVAQELVSRVLASRSASIARYACFTGAGIYLVIGLIPVGLGLIGPALVPNLEDSEQLLPALAQEHLSTFFYIVFAGALVSAILSTVDSTLLACASLVSHNVIVPLAPGMSEAEKVRTARGMVIAFGVIAYVMALYAEGVYALVEEASSFGSAGLVAALVFGVATKWGGVYTGVTTFIVGLVSYYYFGYIAESETPFILSLVAAIVAWWVVALIEGRRKGELVPAIATN